MRDANGLPMPDYCGLEVWIKPHIFMNNGIWWRMFVPRVQFRNMPMRDIAELINAHPEAYAMVGL